MLGRFREGGCSPGKKNGEIWCNLGVPKYVITNQKIKNFKDNKQQQQNLLAIFVSQMNLNVHTSM